MKIKAIFSDFDGVFTDNHVFIDERGYVLEMKDMIPNTETPHCSANKVRFALELETKWLKSTNITLKSRITNLDSVDD